MQSTVRLSALGPITVTDAGRPVPIGAPRRKALLGLLMCSAPHAVTIDRLAAGLWSGSPPADPRRNLQVHVSALRAILGVGAVETSGGGYRLALPLEAIDAHQFEQAVRAARVAQGAAAVDVADAALALWRGEAYADLRHLPELAPEAERLDALRLDIEVVRAESLLALGRPGDLPRLSELHLRHPEHEGLLAVLMLAKHREGRQTEALADYATHRRRKVEETGLEPGAQLQRLHARILADDPGLRCEAESVRLRRHLPSPATEFTGRERELSSVLDQLRDPRTRLLTLIGPGGVGKTRLAIQAAHDLAGDYPDGVWFVGLDTLEETALVAESIARAWELTDETGPVEPLVVRHVRERSLLLVLDNFEHLLDAAVLASRLVEASPGSKVLVTSREPLRVYGEQVREVPPLELSDAVRLFTTRATARAPWFDGSDADRLTTVCNALDRLPLALELVAAHAEDLSLSEIEEALGESLDLVSYPWRDRSPRQRSIRGALAWSVSRLTPEQAAGFARLGAFAGGFEAAAADLVGGVDSDLLAVLVGANLVRADGDDRYRLLRTVRAYARELLPESEHEVVLARLADWETDVAVAAVEGMRSQERGWWLVRLDAERDNVRASLEWLVSQVIAGSAEAAESALRLGGAIGLFWYRTSPGTDDLAWLRRALDAAPEAAAPLRGRVHYALAICAAEMGQVDAALTHCREAVGAIDVAQDPAWAARALNSLAGITRDFGDPVAAGPMMERAIALRRELADPALPLPIALSNRAMAALDLGDLDVAQSCLDECLELGGDPFELAAIHRQLADLSLARGEHEAARTWLSVALPVLREAGLTFRLTEFLDTCATLAVATGDSELAATLTAAADRALAEAEATLVPADAALREARVGAAIAALDPQARCAAQVDGERLGLEEALDLVQGRLLAPPHSRG